MYHVVLIVLTRGSCFLTLELQLEPIHLLIILSMNRFVVDLCVATAKTKSSDTFCPRLFRSSVNSLKEIKEIFTLKKLEITLVDTVDSYSHCLFYYVMNQSVFAALSAGMDKVQYNQTHFVMHYFLMMEVNISGLTQLSLDPHSMNPLHLL